MTKMSASREKSDYVTDQITINIILVVEINNNSGRESKDDDSIYIYT